MFIQRYSERQTKHEYGCDFRRLYPWGDVVDPTFWGSGWCRVAPGEATTPHSHDEHETFIVTKGQGELSVDDETQTVNAGDVIYLPPFSTHTIKNATAEGDLEVLCVWWGSAEARERTREMLNQEQQ